MKVVITIIWVGAVFLFLVFKWDVAAQMKPNEWGDFLAGTFAPIAFLWLIFGYIQQGKELEQNTRALELQAEELKQMVEAQRMEVDLAQKTLSFQVGEKLFVTSGPTHKTLTRNRPSLEACVCLTVRTPGRPVSNVTIKIESGPEGSELDNENLGDIDRMRRINLYIPWSKTVGYHREEVALIVAYSDPFGQCTTSRKLAIIEQKSQSEITSSIYDERT